MTRRLGIIALLLSLLLHGGLLLVPGWQRGFSERTAIRVSLKPLPVVRAVTAPPAEPPPPPVSRPEPVQTAKPEPPTPVKQPPPQPRPEPQPAPTAVTKPAEQPPPATTPVREATEAAVVPPQPATATVENVADSAVLEDQTGAITPIGYLSTPLEYPERYRVRGWEGTVLLQATITTAGKATKLELLESSGYPLLDRAALSQVRKWRFRPATLDGEAIEMNAKVPVVFELH